MAYRDSSRNAVAGKVAGAPTLAVAAVTLLLCFVAGPATVTAQSLCPEIGGDIPSFCSANSNCDVIKCQYVGCKTTF